MIDVQIYCVYIGVHPCAAQGMKRPAASQSVRASAGSECFFWGAAGLQISGIWRGFKNDDHWLIMVDYRGNKGHMELYLGLKMMIVKLSKHYQLGRNQLC